MSVNSSVTGVWMPLLAFWGEDLQRILKNPKIRKTMQNSILNLPDAASVERVRATLTYPISDSPESYKLSGLPPAPWADQSGPTVAQHHANSMVFGIPAAQNHANRVVIGIPVAQNHASSVVFGIPAGQNHTNYAI